MTDCEYCVYARDHGWWGPDMPDGGTHCSTCHQTWAGKAMVHCTCCHLTFSTNGAADKGHKKDGSVYSKASLKRRGLARRPHAHGKLWGYKSPEATAELEGNQQEGRNERERAWTPADGEKPPHISF